MKNIFVILIITVALVSCGSHTGSETDSVTAIETSVALTDAQFKAAAIQIGKIEIRSISTTLKLNGKIDVPPQNMVSVSTPFGGFLKSTKLLPTWKINNIFNCNKIT